MFLNKLTSSYKYDHKMTGNAGYFVMYVSYALVVVMNRNRRCQYWMALQSLLFVKYK
jgi:hypothetical protein